VRSFDALRTDLTHALINFDEVSAESIMAEAFAMYPLEQVGEELVTPVLVEIGDKWHRNELSVTREHFATNYLLHRLTALLRTVPNLGSGPLLWVGCAPGELHEGGAVLLALYLRRAGYRIHYLGQDLPVDDFVGEVRRRHPAMVLLSASTAEALPGLRRMAEELAVIEAPRPLIGYGGRIFIRHPELREQVPGTYVGDSAQEAVVTLRTLLSDPQSNGRASGTNAQP
jgi:methanogenic corrinoid protein MtbC1